MLKAKTQITFFFFIFKRRQAAEREFSCLLIFTPVLHLRLADSACFANLLSPFSSYPHRNETFLSGSGFLQLVSEALCQQHRILQIFELQLKALRKDVVTHVVFNLRFGPQLATLQMEAVE